MSEAVTQAGMSRRQVAVRIGVDHTFLGAVCAGRSMPSVMLLIGLHREFGISTHWLLTGEGSQRAEPATSLSAGVLPHPVASPLIEASEAVELARRMRTGVWIDGAAVPSQDAPVHRHLQEVLSIPGMAREGIDHMLHAAASLATRPAGSIRSRRGSASGVG